MKTKLRNVDYATRLFDKYGTFIRAVIDYQVSDEEVQEDIYQEFFLLFVAKPVPDDVENVKSFLYKIINDYIKDRYRSRKRYQRRIKQYSVKVNNHDFRNEPSKKLENFEELKYFLGVLKRKLSTKEREAIEYKYRHGWDIHEISRKMDIDKRSVSRYVSVGLKKIKDYYEEKQKT